MPIASRLYALGQATLQLLRGRLYVRFALGLVALGCTVLATPLWELVLRLVVPALERNLQIAPGPSITIDSLATQLTGVSLIIAGVAVFFYFYRKEQAAERNELRNASYLTFRLVGGNNWIGFEEEQKCHDDPTYSYHIGFLLEAGARQVRIYEFRIVRWVAGCECWMKAAKLVLGTPPVEHDYAIGTVRLPVPHVIPPFGSVRVFCSGQAAGPAPGFAYHEMEDAEYSIDVSYRFEGETDDKLLERFVSQCRGSMSEVQNITPPPILNNTQLDSARQQSLISDGDYAAIKGVSERNRYLAIRRGKEHYSSHPEQQHLDAALRRCHEAMRTGRRPIADA